jgi:hypothetical protein
MLTPISMPVFYHSPRWQTLNRILSHLIYQQRKEKISLPEKPRPTLPVKADVRQGHGS